MTWVRIEDEQGPQLLHTDRVVSIRSMEYGPKVALAISLDNGREINLKWDKADNGSEKRRVVGAALMEYFKPELVGN